MKATGIASETNADPNGLRSDLRRVVLEGEPSELEFEKTQNEEGSSPTVVLVISAGRAESAAAVCRPGTRPEQVCCG